MAKRRTVDDKLAALDELDDDDARASTVLRSALADRHHRVVARAARLCAGRHLVALTDALTAAYARLLDDPVKRDRGCVAKSALIKALYELDYLAPDFYLRAQHYRQMEPAWGQPQDTAVDIRCTAAFGLAASRYPRTVVELAGLLHDREPAVRVAAAEALGLVEPVTAVVALRVKTLSGDEAAPVVGQCLSSLLKLEPEESAEFVAAFLDQADDEVRDLAALALGECGSETAFGHLKACWDRPYQDWEFREVLLRAIALIRRESTTDFLVWLIGDTDARTAITAIDALSIYRDNTTVTHRVRDVVAQRAETAIREAFDHAWKTDRA